MKPKSPPKRGRPRSGAALTAAERMRQLRARRKQAGLKAVSSWVPAGAPTVAVYSCHRRTEARSLALHTLIAEKIARDPRLLEIPKRNLNRWAARRGNEAPRWIEEWRRLRKRPWQEVAATISEATERAARLRQSSPFAGVLTPQERQRVYDAFRA